MPTDLQEAIAEYTQCRAAAFPGSRQAQATPWSTAVQLTNDRDNRSGGRADALGPFFYTTVYHSDFDPDWPITTDWPSVVRGLRGSMHLSQVDFANTLGLGRATVERWEAGKVAPFGGKALDLLSLVRGHLRTPLQAGQALNLAAAAVLPHMTRPTARYTGHQVAQLLRTNKHDHLDFGPPLLNALTEARILVVLDAGRDELDSTYFPLAARAGRDSKLPPWGRLLIDTVAELSDSDRRLIVDLARRLPPRE